MQILSSFEKQVKNALKWFDDPERLGNESPLASAYFLSHAIQDQVEPAAARARGEALRAALRRAAATLWGGPLPAGAEEMRRMIPEVRQQPGTRRYSYLVIELRVFQEHLRPRKTFDIWESEEY